MSNEYTVIFTSSMAFAVVDENNHCTLYGCPSSRYYDEERCHNQWDLLEKINADYKETVNNISYYILKYIL